MIDVGISSINRSYVVGVNLQIGRTVYIDRAYTYTGVPSSVQGASYIRTANNDKSLQGSLVFTIDRPVVVYVAHDVRISPKPSWLNSFEDTSEDLTTSDTTLRLFSRKYPTAGPVSLGENGGTGNSMYTVCLQPLPPEPCKGSPLEPMFDSHPRIGVPLFGEDSLWRSKLISDPSTYLELLKQTARDLVANPNHRHWAWISRNKTTVPYFRVTTDIPRVPVYVKDKTNTLILNALMQSGVPIPDEFVYAPGNDGHAFIADEYHNVGYEFYKMKQDDNGDWFCQWGAVIPNLSNHTGRLDVINGEKHGARASSLALMGGVMLLSELESGVIPHAIAVGVPKSSEFWQFPAARTDTSSVTTHRVGIPYGLRFRFPADIIIPDNYEPWTKMMMTAIRDYGMVPVDQTFDKFIFYAEDRTRFMPEGTTDPAFEYRQFHPKGGVERVVDQLPFEKLVLA